MRKIHIAAKQRLALFLESRSTAAVSEPMMAMAAVPSARQVRNIQSPAAGGAGRGRQTSNHNASSRGSAETDATVGNSAMRSQREATGAVMGDEQQRSAASFLSRKGVRDLLAGFWSRLPVGSSQAGCGRLRQGRGRWRRAAVRRRRAAPVMAKAMAEADTPRWLVAIAMRLAHPEFEGTAEHSPKPSWFEINDRTGRRCDIVAPGSGGGQLVFVMAVGWCRPRRSRARHLLQPGDHHEEGGLPDPTGDDCRRPRRMTMRSTPRRISTLPRGWRA